MRTLADSEDPDEMLPESTLFAKTIAMFRERIIPLDPSSYHNMHNGQSVTSVLHQNIISKNLFVEGMHVSGHSCVAFFTIVLRLHSSIFFPLKPYIIHVWHKRYKDKTNLQQKDACALI